MGQDDRRKFARTKKQSIVSFYVIEGDKEGAMHQGLILDGSPGGIRFRSNHAMKKNTKIYIRLNSDDWGEELTYHIKKDQLGLIEIIGSVMWCLETQDAPGEFEVGTRFVSNSDQ